MESHSTTTKLQMREITLHWTIENWSLHTLKKTDLYSREFRVTEAGRICQFTITISNPNYLNILIQKCPELKNAEVSAYVLNDDDEKIPFTDSHQYEKKYNDKDYLGHACEIDEQFVKDDTLELCCSIEYIHEYTDVKKFIRNESCVNKDLIFDTYGNFYKSQELCDVTFLVGEEKMKAHILVLAAASPYFLAMFTHDNTKENQQKMVDFSEDTEINPKNLKGFLDCIYGCKTVWNMPLDMVLEIVVLANKFGVDALKECCENYLIKYLDTNNVTKFLVVAELYQCVYLKKEALFIAKMNIDSVKNSDEFEDLYNMKELIRELL